jgi:RNA polymerase sigma factor (sigma-70 family)
MEWSERARGAGSGGPPDPAPDAGGARARARRAELRVVSGQVYPDWEAVYRDNVDRVYGLMFSKVGNRADAEDLTAEVFLAALRPLRISASVGEVRAYLAATARTVLAGHWRRTLGREVTVIADAASLIPDLPAHVDAPDGEFAEVSARAAGVAAEGILAGLPERYRRVLSMRFLHGYSLRETAAALGITVGNTKVLQHRALRRAAQLGDGRRDGEGN